jgi:hypothetical protein
MSKHGKFNEFFKLVKDENKLELDLSFASLENEEIYTHKEP